MQPSVETLTARYRDACDALVEARGAKDEAHRRYSGTASVVADKREAGRDFDVAKAAYARAVRTGRIAKRALAEAGGDPVSLAFGPTRESARPNGAARAEQIYVPGGPYNFWRDLTAARTSAAAAERLCRNDLAMGAELRDTDTSAGEGFSRPGTWQTSTRWASAPPRSCAAPAPAWRCRPPGSAWRTSRPSRPGLPSTPSAANFDDALYKAQAAFAETRHAPGEYMLMHPRRACYLAGARDASHPLFDQGGLAPGAADASWSAGPLAGLRALVSSNVPTDVSSDQDAVVLFRGSGVLYAMTEARFAYNEAASSMNAVVFQAVTYSYFWPNRRGGANVLVMSGTGLTPKNAFQNEPPAWRSLRQIRLQPIARKASWMSARRS